MLSLNKKNLFLSNNSQGSKNTTHASKKKENISPLVILLWNSSEYEIQIHCACLKYCEKFFIFFLSYLCLLSIIISVQNVTAGNILLFLIYFPVKRKSFFWIDSSVSFSLYFSYLVSVFVFFLLFNNSSLLCFHFVVHIYIYSFYIHSKYSRKQAREREREFQNFFSIILISFYLSFGSDFFFLNFVFVCFF